MYAAVVSGKSSRQVSNVFDGVALSACSNGKHQESIMRNTKVSPSRSRDIRIFRVPSDCCFTVGHLRNWESKVVSFLLCDATDNKAGVGRGKLPCYKRHFLVTVAGALQQSRSAILEACLSGLQTRTLFQVA